MLWPPLLPSLPPVVPGGEHGLGWRNMTLTFSSALPLKWEDCHRTVRKLGTNKDILIPPSSAPPDPPKSVSWAVFRPPPLFWRGRVVAGVGFVALVPVTESSPGRWGIVGTSDAVEPDLVRLKEWLGARFKRASRRLADIVYLSSSARFRFRG